MNLLVTLESILYNNLKLEEIWSEFGNLHNIIKLIQGLLQYFTGQYIIKGNLQSLPYSSYFMNMYSEELKKYTDIVLAVPQEYQLYIPMLQTNLSNLKKFRQIVIYANDRELTSLCENRDTFLHSFSLVKKHNSKFMITQNIFSYLRLLLTTNVHSCRMSIFNGSLWIIWSLFSYYIPLAFMWPFIFRLSDIFNKTHTFAAAGILILHVGFIRLLRTLSEIDYERKFAQTNNYEPLCGKEYIFYGSSINVATIILFILLSIITICFIKYFTISLVLSIVSIIYYFVILSNIFIKSIIISIALIFAHSLLQYRWILSIFRG